MSNKPPTTAQEGLLRYRKRAGLEVIAVQLNLDTEGFDYQKWGDTQRCKPGDWIVNNRGNVYTVDADTFAATYREVDSGRFVKVSKVWAEQAGSAGTIQTKEGTTHYEASDYLVYNGPSRTDGYAMSEAEFQDLYEPVAQEKA